MNRVLEELFPFVFYLVRDKRLVKKAKECKTIAKSDSYRAYRDLGTDGLEARLTEEQERAHKIDEKTAKFTLSFGAVFSVLSVLGAFASNEMIRGKPHWSFLLLLYAPIVYMVAGAIIALGSLKTLPTHGYGTKYQLRLREEAGDTPRTEALVGQELVNNRRHLRNEAAYQCLRNGLLCLLVSVFALAIRQYWEPRSPAADKSLEQQVGQQSSDSVPNRRSEPE